MINIVLIHNCIAFLYYLFKELDYAFHLRGRRFIAENEKKKKNHQYKA